MNEIQIEARIRKILTDHGADPGSIDKYIEAVADAGVYDMYVTMTAEEIFEDLRIFENLER